MTTVTRRSAMKIGLAALTSAPIMLATSRAARAATHQVTIEGFAFVPATLQVAVGDTVVFTNNDGAPHTATAEAGGFDTGRLSRGASGEITITAAGTFSYRCKFHPNMKGAITAS